MKSLKENYPFPAFRPGVEELLDNLDSSENMKYFIIRGRTGCHSPGTKVIMHDGTLRKVEDVKVGDALMGPDSGKREVLHLFSGQDEMYRVTPKKGGDSFVINKGHILSLISTNAGHSQKGKKFTGKEISDISVEDYLIKSNKWRHLHKLFRAKVDFDTNLPLPVQPYFLGLLLGDGSLDKRIAITTIDEEIKNYTYEMAKHYGLAIRVESKLSTDCKTYNLTAGRSQKVANPVIAHLKNLGLYGSISDSKFIPFAYKTASLENRLQLLAGLMDSDGSLSKNCFDYVSKSKALADDVAFVARSVGLCVSHNEKIVNDTTYYRLSISGETDKIPCILSRKQGTNRRQIKRANVSGFALTSIGTGQYHGFMLDGDHRYLLEDFTVTHNSGKSGIAVAISRKHSAHILTATKLLQDQYAATSLFDSEFVLKGKSNYTCSITGGSTGDAPCSSRKLLQIARSKYNLEEKVPPELKQNCAKNNICEYYKKKYALPFTSGGILNYDLAFSSGFTGGAVVLDEAHNFIDKVLDFYSLEIPTKRIFSLLKIKDLPNQTNYVDWLKRIKTAAAMRAEMASDSKTRDQCKQIADRVSAILQEACLPGDFYVDTANEKVQIKPIYPAAMAHKFLSRFKKVYFLSATIDVNFAKILGLDPSSTVEFNLESTFPSQNRPIYFPKDIPTVNYSTKFSKDMPALQVLDAVLDRHKNQRGIIHTSNYRVFSALQIIYGTDRRFTWVEQGANKSVALAQHRLQEDSILVSPSMMEGVDLADDLGRFQVIMKLPFPARSEYMEALNNAMPGIYEMATRNSLVQAYGRAVRSEDDWAHTYVLDGSLRFMLESIDSYFAKAVKMGSWEKLKGALQSGSIGSDIQAKQEK